tara:strand:+ start:73 stop:276 length:204 start_codon:yes stop_codon:yes gene_type:complete
MPPMIPTEIMRLFLWFLNPRYRANELIGIIKNNSISWKWFSVKKPYNGIDTLNIGNARQWIKQNPEI